MLTSRFFGATDIGLVRKRNEDTFISQNIWDERHVLLAAIDGLGGYAGGDVAAAIARQEIIAYLNTHKEGNTLNLLKSAVAHANNAIIEAKKVQTEFQSMGCCVTAALLSLDDRQLDIAHIGDTRLYSFIGGNLVKLTHDHSLVGFREEIGDLSEEDAMNHPQRNVIEKFAGDKVMDEEDPEEIDGAIFTLMPEATLMLCSDGLTDLVTSTEIIDILQSAQPLEEHTSALIQKAKEKGGKDNITVVLATLKEKFDKPAEQTQPTDNATHKEGFTSVYSTRQVRKKQKSFQDYGRTMIAMMLIIAFMLFGFWRIHSNYSPVFDATEKAYDNHLAQNLDKNLNNTSLRNLLLTAGYVDDEKDAAYIADFIDTKLAERDGLTNLGALNTHAFQCAADEAWEQGGEWLKRRVEVSRSKLGWTPAIDSLYHKANANSTFEQHGGDTWLTVNVMERQDSLAFLPEIWARITGNFRTPVSGVVVRLREHYYEGEKDNRGRLLDPHAEDSIVGYATTDAEGKAVFKVKDGCFYSVLPVRQGYEYGMSKGTTTNAIAGDTRYTFLQKVHRMPIFDAQTYSNIKNDGTLTVRTPMQYKNSLVSGIVHFIVIWLLAFLIILYRDRKEENNSDHVIPLVVMALTGLSLMMMYAIARPLTDSLMGKETAIGITIGVALLVLLSNMNILQLHNTLSAPVSRWISSRKEDGQLKNRTEGIGYAVIAIILMMLLYIFGNGPEGSDAKVNLWGFQPSELTKLLIVFFMAAFFAKNAKRIQAFSEQTSRFYLKKQLQTVAVIVIGMMVLLMMYIKLSDLGPALVVTITFIMLYSVARKDLLQLLIGTTSFCLILWVAHLINPGSVFTTLLFALLWFVAWIAGGIIWKRRVYESALFLNLLIVVFLFCGRILTDMGMSEGIRLERRSDMAWSGVWNNNTPGGDQVAQGIWSLSTGGFFGQGLGRGNANMVPACNTDMIFTSTGEILGWLALSLVVIAFVILLHRSLLCGRRAGHPFAFFLISGIALATAVQFLIIVAGSIGLIPLTGVSVPYMSFGKSAVIINLAAAGIILSLSRLRGTKNQAADIRRYDNVVAGASGSFIIAAAVILAVVFNYQVISRNHYLIKPAYVANTEGYRIQEYNPRIGLLVSKMPVGNIYDRNGLIIATSSADSIMRMTEQLVDAGLDQTTLEKIAKRRQKRLYPFEDQLFFMTGDFNTRVLWNNNEMNPYGYMAENTHLAWLRGFDNTARDEQGNRMIDSLKTRLVRESRFLYPIEPTDKEKYVRRDYSELLTLLKQGTDNEVAQSWTRHQDVRLTVDAKLQTHMQQKMEENAFNGFTHKYKNKMRASVVVMNPESGDLLCSANYPAPAQKAIQSNAAFTYYEQAEKDLSTQAYTDRDLGLTYQSKPGSTAKVLSALAAFMKYGSDAENFGYQLLGGERISHRDTTFYRLKDALVHSSNSYFVKLVHDKRLYTELDSLYKHLGLNIQIDPFNGNKRRNRSITPYFLDPSLLDEQKSRAYDNEMNYLASVAYEKWNSYQEKRVKDPRYVERFSDPKQGWTKCGCAWGQYNIKATPLNMALAVSTVVNGGMLVPVRFAFDNSSGSQPMRLIDMTSAERMKSMMEAEAQKWPQHHLPAGTGGKTGTPVRLFDGKNVNDAWYVCFIPKKSGNGYLSVVVRLERSVINSKAAVKYLGDVVLPVLRSTGYTL